MSFSHQDYKSFSPGSLPSPETGVTREGEIGTPLEKVVQQEKIGQDAYEGIDTIGNNSLFTPIQVAQPNNYDALAQVPSLVPPYSVQPSRIPTSDNVTQAQALLTNQEKLLGELENIAKKIQKDLPSNNPLRITLDDFLEIVGEALNELKKQLRAVQMGDAEQSKQATQAKFDQAEDRRKRSEELAEKIREQRIAQRKQDKFTSVMKIVTPIIAVTAAIVGAGILIATAGAALPLVIAGIAVGMAFMSYSIVDSFLGITPQIIQKFNEFIEEMTPDASPLKRSIIKAMIVAAIISALVIVVAAIVLSGAGAGAGANIATQTVAQIIKQATFEATKQASLQLMILVVAASNALPELVGSVLESQGVDKNSSRFAQAFVAGMQLIFITLIMLISSGKSSTTTATATQKISSVAKESVKSIQQAVLKMVQELQRIITNLKEGAIEAAKTAANRLADLVAELLRQIKNLPSQLRPMAETIIHSIKETTDGLIRQIQQIPTRVREAAIAAAVATANHLHQLIDNLSDHMSHILNSAEQLAAHTATVTLEKMKQILASIEKTAEELLARVKDVPGYLEKGSLAVLLGIIQSLRKIFWEPGFVGLLLKAAQTLPLAADITSNIIKAKLTFEVSEMLREVGELKSAEELLQSLIQLLEKLLKDLQSGIDMNSEFILSLQRDFTHLYESASRNAGKIMQTLQARG